MIETILMFFFSEKHYKMRLIQKHVSSTLKFFLSNYVLTVS